MSDPAILSHIDNRLLREIQSGFPLVQTPYERLARSLGHPAETVHAAVGALRRRGIVRRIGASYVAERLGHVTTLVALAVVPDRLDAVARRIGDFPEVTHNYERDHALNLWFTLVASDRLRLEAIVAAVAVFDGVWQCHALPAIRTFKLQVEFPFGETPAQAVRAAVRPAASTVSASVVDPFPLTPSDRRLIARTCGDLGPGLRPYADVAADVNLSEVDVTARLNAFKQAGVMRRFGAFLRHREAGFVGNGLTVWNVPEDRVAEVGGALAACPEISHCYQRRSVPGWPYNLYGMMHGRSLREVDELAARLAAETGIHDYSVLATRREFKKSTRVYFAEENRQPPSE